jgi:hypothetical protein
MPARLDMDSPTWVPEAKWVARHGWGWVALIVHPCELSDLGVKECCPGRTSNLTSPQTEAEGLKAEALTRLTPRIVVPMGRSSHMNKRVELCQRSAERVGGLCSKESRNYNLRSVFGG